MLLDASDYQQKIDKVLFDGSYSMLDKDPKRKLEARLSKVLTHLDKEGKLPSELRRRLTPAQSYTPLLYGLSKLHQEGIPLRSIVSTIGSPCYFNAKELTRILTHPIGRTNKRKC